MKKTTQNSQVFVLPRRMLSLVMVMQIFLGACHGIKDSKTSGIGAKEIAAENPGLFSTVGIVLTDDVKAIPFCSGVLVSESQVLTAAHCFYNVKDPASIRLVFSQDLAARTADGRPPQQNMNVTSIVSASALIAEKIRAVKLEPRDFFPSFDLAVVTLAEPLPKGYKPARLLPPALQSRAFQAGKKHVGVGFGRTKEDQLADGLKRTLSMTFESYSETSLARGLIVYRNSDGTGVCYGDSGGPTYVELDGIWYIAGIVNGKANALTGPDATKCIDTVAVYTHPSAHAFFLKNGAGVDPGFVSNYNPYTFGTVYRAAKSFSELCDNPLIPFSAWYTLVQVANTISQVNCQQISSTIMAKAELDLSSLQIFDLTPLAYFTQLKSLSLRNSKMDSIAGLERLTQLESLDLSYNFALKDVSALQNLSSLKTMNLQATGIQPQICPLANKSVCKF